MVPGATFTLASELAEVGLRPSKKGQFGSSAMIERSSLTEVVAGQTDGTGHDAH